MAELAGYVGALYAQSGNAIAMTAKAFGTGDAATTTFYLVEPVIDCEAVSPTASGSILAGDWTSSGATAQNVAVDGGNEKEGTYAIKNTVSVVAGTQTCLCLFTMDDTQDWHDRARIGFWFESDRASTSYTNARFEVVDSSNNRSYWNLTFAASTWKRFNLLLGTPDGNSGSAAVLTLVKKVQLSFVAADATGFYQQIDWIGITPKAINRTVTITNAGTATTTFTKTPRGVIEFATAPANTNALVATYSYYATAQVVGFFDWSVTRNTEALEATDFSDAGVRTYIVGVKNWTGTATRHWHTLTANKITGWVGQETVINFFIDATVDPRLVYEGWAITTGIDLTDPVDSIINEAVTFQGTDWLQYEST